MVGWVTSALVPGTRILISGMGGELGSYVAQLLEALPWVDEIVGIDIDPPRMRLRRAQFERVAPGARDRVARLAHELDPHMVVHLGVYEPAARCDPAQAERFTKASAAEVLGAAAAAPSLQAIVVRSGLEVYGRRRGSPAVPDESVRADPTSPFGRSVHAVEEQALAVGHRRDVPVTLLRFANLVGPHFPSPLGRYLRMPVVPVSGISDPAFSLLHRDDAARAVVAAIEINPHGPINVAGAGVVSPWRAVRTGNRLPWPVVGPGWWLARSAASVAGAPLPEHLHELLTRGRAADISRLRTTLRMLPRYTTSDVVKDLYEWATVTRLRPRVAA